jgi:hypothetical protein
MQAHWADLTSWSALAAMWTCPQCGESVEDSFDACWNCGTTKEGASDSDVQAVGKPARVQ